MGKNKGVIYCIKNKTNGKKYIGQTINLNKRFSKHQWALKENEHYNQHLQRSWNKYGADNFEFEILQSGIPETKLNNKEIHYIDKYNTYQNGYNLTLGGEGKRGFEVPEETKRKMSAASKGKLSEEHKLKISKTHSNKTLSEKHKKHISEAMKKTQQGSNNNCAKSTREQAMELYKEYHNTNKSQREIARNSDLSRRTVQRIVNCNHWATKHL